MAEDQIAAQGGQGGQLDPAKKLDYDQLNAKLNSIPEGDREEYVKQLRGAGYHWESRMEPEESLGTKAARVVRDAAPTAVGMMYGAAKGAAMAPRNPLMRGIGAALGAGMGAAGMEGATDVAKAAFNKVVPGANPPETAAGIAAKTGAAAKSGVEGEMVGGAVEGGGKLGWNKLIAMNPAARVATDQAIATAKSMGFKLLPSQETQNYLAGLFENVMQKLPGGDAIFQRFESEQKAAYTAAKNQIAQSFGKDTELQFGQKLGDAIKSSNDIVQARADALLQKGLVSKEAYDAAMQRHQARLAQIASDSLREGRQGAAASIGGFPTPEGRGVAVQLERAHQAALDKLAKDALWEKALVGEKDAAGNLVRPAMPPELNQSAAANLQKASQGVVKDLEGADITEGAYKAAKKNLQGAADPEAEKLLSAAEEFGYDKGAAGAAAEGPKTYTLQDLQRKRNMYGALADGQRNTDGSYNPMGRMYARLQTAVEADMDAMFAAPGVPAESKVAYQTAKAFSKEQFGLADLKVVKGLWDQNPSAVLDNVVKMGDKRGTQILIQALGGSEVGKTQIRRHIFDEIFGAGDRALPTHAQIMKGLSDYSDNISVLFSKDEQKQLYQLAQDSKTPAFVQDQYNKRVKAILDSYRMRANAARDPVLAKLANQRPQQLVQAVMRGDPEVVVSLRKYLPAQEFSAYQQYGMRDLLADPVLPQKGTQAIKDKLMAKPEFYKELLGEKNYADMMRIGDAELLLPGYKDLKAPSKLSASEARMGMAATFGVMGLMLHPFGNRALSTVAGVGLGLTISPQALSAMYLSDSGRKIVTTLLRLPEADPRSAYLIGRLAAAGYVTQTTQGMQGPQAMQGTQGAARPGAQQPQQPGGPFGQKRP